MTNANPLTGNELQAAAYFAVGVASEGSIAGRDLAYRLSFAGNVGPDGRMRPVANSGYSFGTMQVDLGQHPAVARDLLDHYQAWAATQPDRALEFAPDEYETSAACAQECEALDAAGKTIRDAVATVLQTLPAARSLAAAAAASSQIAAERRFPIGLG